MNDHNNAQFIAAVPLRARPVMEMWLASWIVAVQVERAVELASQKLQAPPTDSARGLIRKQWFQAAIWLQMSAVASAN